MRFSKSIVFATLVVGWLWLPLHAQTTLKDAYQGSFWIGAALNRAIYTDRDATGAALVKSQFSSITPENDLKWQSVHPTAQSFEFAAADRFVEFGEMNHMFIAGHCLVWQHQTPRWVFEDDKGNPVSRDELLKRMHEHIQTVVGRYKGRVKSWDVVNEALEDDGTLRQTPWMKIIGEDYIAKAFQFAHEADPEAQLIYNDYAMENEAKRNGAITLIKKLKDQGVPITGVGLQGHYDLEWPTPEQEDATIAAFGNLGIKVMITEFDIDVLPRANRNHGADVTLNVEAQAKLNPYVDGLPDAMQQTLAKRYADLFAVFLKHPGLVSRVTFWGVTDAGSWLNFWPVRGRTNYPLLFDRHGQPKPAFYAVIKTASAKQETAK